MHPHNPLAVPVPAPKTFYTSCTQTVHYNIKLCLNKSQSRTSALFSMMLTSFFCAESCLSSGMASMLEMSKEWGMEVWMLLHRRISGFLFPPARWILRLLELNLRPFAWHLHWASWNRHFGCILVSSNPSETEREEPKEQRKCPVRFEGGHGAQGLGWEPGLLQFSLLRLLDIQSSCVRDVRAYPCFQGPFLDLISSEHADTVCTHHPLCQHLAEVLYQLCYVGSLNSGWGYVLLGWSPALLWQVSVPVSPCGHRGVGFLGALVSAGKALMESHCLQGEVTALGWHLGLQFCF